MRLLLAAAVIGLAACAPPAARRPDRAAALMKEVEQALDKAAPAAVAPALPSPAQLLAEKHPAITVRGESVDFDEVGLGQALSSETQEAAVARAREDALAKAMMGAADVFYGFTDVTIESDRDHRESAAKFLFTSNRGVLTELSSGAPDCEVKDRVTTCRLRVRGAISFRGNIDPSYLIMDQHSGKALGLDRRQYYDGEPVSLTVAATKESYLYLFSWDENDDLYLVYPDRPGRDNRIAAETAVTLPAAGSGVNFRAVLPSGKTQSAERMLIIASQKEVIMPEAPPAKDTVAAHKVGTLTDIMKRLAQLDRKDWTLQVISYDIVARKLGN